MKIAIITDGNNTLGMGHVYQAMTLCERLSDRTGSGIETRILTSSGDAVVHLLEKTGSPVSRHETDESIMECLGAFQPDRVVIDKLDVAPGLAKRISEELQAKLIIMTNLTAANEYADVTVMAGMGSSLKNVRKNGPGGQVQLWGPRYWLIRPEFFRFPGKKVTSIRKIMLIFGGADQANLSSLVLAELLGMDSVFDITVVLGAAFADRIEFDATVRRHVRTASTVRVVENLVAVAATMHESDLVIASPGLSFFEALSVGTPVLCFHQNDFQEQAWSGLIKTYGRKEVALVGELIESRAFILPDDIDILAMEAGKGADEILEEILL